MTVREALDAALPIVVGPFAPIVSKAVAGEIAKETNDVERAAVKTFLTDVAANL